MIAHPARGHLDATDDYVRYYFTTDQHDSIFRVLTEAVYICSQWIQPILAQLRPSMGSGYSGFSEVSIPDDVLTRGLAGRPKLFPGRGTVYKMRLEEGPWRSGEAES